jgi:hypothetical protein
LGAHFLDSLLRKTADYNVCGPDGRTPCFCVRDPDGHEVELYVEVSPAEA